MNDKRPKEIWYRITGLTIDVMTVQRRGFELGCDFIMLPGDPDPEQQSTSSIAISGTDNQMLMLMIDRSRCSFKRYKSFEAMMDELNDQAYDRD